MSTKAISNCNFDCAKQLVKTAKFLWAVEGYIRDARKEGHKECAKMWEKIKKDEMKHAEMLRKNIEHKAKIGKFR